MYLCGFVCSDVFGCLLQGYQLEARGYVIYSSRALPEHEENKSHNYELKADKRLIFTLARIPRDAKIPLLFIFLLFFNTPCWDWWHSNVSRLFSYVSFSKSHLKLVLRSEW